MSAIPHSNAQPYSPTIQALSKIDPNHLAHQLKKNTSAYQKLVGIASEKNIDISQQTKKMQQVINGLPTCNESHQFRNMSVLYVIKMYEKYNKEIGRKIAQNGLYHEKEESLLNQLQDQAMDINEVFQKWIGISNNKDIDVSQQMKKMQQVLAEQPMSDAKHQFSAIRLLNEIKMRQLYCIQIICKVAKAEIHRQAQIARETLALEKHISLINECERFLLKQLPLEDCKFISNLSIEKMEQQYDFIMKKMEDMREVIMKKIRRH
jgi:hypothetical protein